MSDKKDFKCVLCDQRFDSRPELQTHFRNHGKGKSFSNSERSKGVSVAEDLPAKCKHCTQSYKTMSDLIRHQFLAHQDKLGEKHYCPHCGKQFVIEQSKTDHLKDGCRQQGRSEAVRIKTKFQCGICPAFFLNFEALKFHCQSAHERVSKMVRPIIVPPPCKKVKYINGGELSSVYYCHLCGTEYTVKYNFQVHLEKHHTAEQRAFQPENVIKCKLCEAVFVHRKAYDAHNKSHSRDDLYLPDESVRNSTVSRIDQDFDAKRIPTIWDLQKINGKVKMGGMASGAMSGMASGAMGGMAVGAMSGMASGAIGTMGTMASGATDKGDASMKGAMGYSAIDHGAMVEEEALDPFDDGGESDVKDINVGKRKLEDDAKDSKKKQSEDKQSCDTKKQSEDTVKQFCVKKRKMEEVEEREHVVPLRRSDRRTKRKAWH